MGGEFSGMSVPPQEWTSGIFDCAEDGSNAIETIFCWPCSMGFMSATLKRMRPGITMRREGPFDYGICCGAAVMSYFCGMGLFVFGCQLRQQTMKIFNIHGEGQLLGSGRRGGDCAESCFYPTFCALCSLCQIHREMNKRGYFPGGFMSKALPPPAGGPFGQSQQQQGQGPLGQGLLGAMTASLGGGGRGGGRRGGQQQQQVVMMQPVMQQQQQPMMMAPGQQQMMMAPGQQPMMMAPGQQQQPMMMQQPQGYQQQQQPPPGMMMM